VAVFVDTSVWYAAADRRDHDNARAKALLVESQPLVTSDHVLLETWTLLRNRIGRAAADGFWDGLQAVAEVECVTPADLEVARRIGSDFPDQDFSFVDRTCFAVMQRLGVLTVAAFDDHFAIYRFGRDRKRAFEVVR
jgi:uncharacterized protein